MRIVSGRFKSRSVKTLKGDITRPTSDKIRGAIFNSVGPYFNGGAFLDVFAGSGAMGIEALSRGMDCVLGFEMNSKAYSLIKDNLKSFDIIDKYTLIKKDALKGLDELSGVFELIFVDPPYRYEYIQEVLSKIVERNLLSLNGLLIVETDKDYDLVDVDGLSCYKEKIYKDTKVRYYERI